MFRYANGVTLNGQRNAFLRVQDKQLLIKGKGEGKEPGCVQKEFYSQIT